MQTPLDSADAMQFAAGLARELAARHGGNLLGVYLHGSLAMGSYVPGKSDVDLLVVLHAPLSGEIRTQEISWLLQASSRLLPGGLEISYLVAADFSPRRDAWPYDLHFGESHRADVQQYLSGLAPWPEAIGPGDDEDLPAHVTVVRARGCALYGPPPKSMFPPVPREHYLASVMADLDWGLMHVAANPSYAVLNLARTLRYLTDGFIGSKQEGGEWLQGRVPEHLRSALLTVIAQQEARAPQAATPEIQRLASWLLDRIHREADPQGR